MTIDDILDVALTEMGLSYEAFKSMPPFKFRLLWMHDIRKRERVWEQTRFIAATICNTTPGAKRSIKLHELVRLSFDHIEKLPEWTRDDALELLDKWPDIEKN